MNHTPHITLFGLFPYDRGAKARWLLTEIGVPFENHWLDREKNEMESPAYLKIHPMGRIPAMEINGKALFESGALCAYLADLFLDKGFAPTLASPDRGDYQKWMYFAASTLDPLQTRMMVIEDIPAGEVFTNKMDALLSEAKDAFHTLNLALTNQSYLVGNQISAADISVGYHLYWCTLWPEFKSLMDECPNVSAYLKRLSERPAAVKAGTFSYEA